MEDHTHRWTDREIAALEKRIRAVYDEAVRDADAKLQRFIRKFGRDDRELKQRLEAGKISAADYRDWLAGQVFQGKRWRAQLADLSETLTRANQVAMSIVNDAAPGVFAMNANWAAFSIEKAGNANMGFGLYDETTVKRLIRDQPKLLPPSRVDVPRDQHWNMKLITGQITQGILQGEGLDTVAKRLQRVATMNFNSARTHARTAMTGAQNAGRIETYHRAAEMGIKLQKEWLATLDSHTRYAHAALDGQRRPTDEPFEIDGKKIMYPGDPSAPPELVYNCRCTMIANIAGWPAENAQSRDDEAHWNIADMTFAEWAGIKQNEQEKLEKPRIPEYNETIVKLASVNGNAVYEAAKNGTRHKGVYTDAVTKKQATLEKSIASHVAQVVEHAEKIENPSKYDTGWGKKDQRAKDGLIRKWEKDKLRNAEQAAVEIAVWEERFGKR